jgi:hypothetical protein
LSRSSKGFSKYNDKTSTSSAPVAAPSVLGQPVGEAKNYGKVKMDDKLPALMTQRKKLGLCMKCGDKWGKGHKCPA